MNKLFMKNTRKKLFAQTENVQHFYTRCEGSSEIAKHKVAKVFWDTLLRQRTGPQYDYIKFRFAPKIYKSTVLLPGKLTKRFPFFGQKH